MANWFESDIEEEEDYSYFDEEEGEDDISFNWEELYEEEDN